MVFAAECRLLDQSFDIASSAGWYSSIAGVLAGFALLAILLPLDHVDDDSDTRATSHAVVVFVAAFFSLLLLAFAYAILAGRTSGGAVLVIAAVEQMALGGVFGLSTILLLVGLQAVLRSYGANRVVFAPAQSLLRIMIGVLGPIVVLTLQFSNSLDVSYARLQIGGVDPGACGVLGFPVGVWINLAIIVAGAIGVGLMAVLRDRIPSTTWAATLVAKMVLALAVTVMVVFAVVVPLLPLTSLTGRVLEHGMLIATTAGALAVAYSAWASR